MYSLGDGLRLRDIGPTERSLATGMITMKQMNYRGARGLLEPGCVVGHRSSEILR